MAKQRTVKELLADVQAAQKLLTTEEADTLIGEDNNTHATLVKATTSYLSMLYHTVMQTQRGKRLHRFAQAQLVMADLVHKAYALGVRDGRNDNS